MSSQQITIELPEPVMRQLMRMAAATQQPIEALITQSVLSNLPPSTDNAPSELQAELLAMQRLSSEELYAIAQTQTATAASDRQVELLERHEDHQFTSEERQELSRLRQAADHLMLRKAYAWALIRWRGHKLPALSDLPTPA
ncbi:MAG: hypothetical protein F6K00_27885 [Leptolyngbya sp. SIOISBB]|nr:hypothetical protein [Leptolyngbya sp. SIOISBB]